MGFGTELLFIVMLGFLFVGPRPREEHVAAAPKTTGEQ